MTKLKQMEKRNLPLRLTALGMINAMGSNFLQIHHSLQVGDASYLTPYHRDRSLLSPLVGKVQEELPVIPQKLTRFDSRNNALLLMAYKQIEEEVNRVIEDFGKGRIGIVLGSSTSGIASTEQALLYTKQQNTFPVDFDYAQHEMGSPSAFLAAYTGIDGPAYTISTACSSSAKTFASGRNLLEAGICDAVIIGGVDSLCQLTISGFSCLGALSKGRCNPMEQNRDGINIGEGAALFLMEAKEGDIQLLGVGESSDAHHITAPDPQGGGAELAMRRALIDANIPPSDIDYINLHGTATPHNDAMESLAVSRVFGEKVLLSSTKPFVGHTLGAAGAMEVGFCWMVISQEAEYRFLPVHVLDGQQDEGLPALSLVKSPSLLKEASSYKMLSNSFAFGGNNCSVIIGRIV